MIAARKPLLLALAAFALLSSLSGCIVAERPGHYRQGPSWNQNQSHWNNGGQGGNWNHYR